MNKLLEEGSRHYLKGNIKKAIDCFQKSFRKQS